MRIRSTELLYLLAGTRIAVAWEHSSEDEFRRAIAGHNHALVACELHILNLLLESPF